VQDFSKEVLEIRDRNPKLSLDNAFVAWAIRALIIDEESRAVDSLKGGARDRGIDALYIDHESRIVFVIQGKYHQGPKIVSEKRNDVIALADLGRALLVNERGFFDKLLLGADPVVKDGLIRARQALHQRKYILRLLFITTGKVSRTHQDDASGQIEN